MDTNLVACSDEEAIHLVVCFIADRLKNKFKNKKLKALKDKINSRICGVAHESEPLYTGEGFEEYIVHNVDGSLFYVYFNSYGFSR